MQITNDQARTCILAIEACNITRNPEHDELWDVHQHLKESLMNDLQFRTMERNGEMPMNDFLQGYKTFEGFFRETQIERLLLCKRNCAVAYLNANNLQSQPSDDEALQEADARFEAALREVVR